MRTIFFEEGVVKMIDQTRLPAELVLHTCGSVQCLIEAIKELKVRGAPALGVAGAYGMLLSALSHRDESWPAFLEKLSTDAVRISNARPTAVNLQWGVSSQMDVVRNSADADGAVMALEGNAAQMADQDIKDNMMIGRYGESLIDGGDNVLTHCNAGALACVDYGTALGVIRAAHDNGKGIHVYVDETRPLCQGSRLTAWEMVSDGIPATLITDNMAGHLMKLGKVQKVVVGADRIAANGDTANKIGTYSLSVLAKHHGIPLIVAAPTSTIDFGMEDGSKIPIEERDGNEIRYWNGSQNAPTNIAVYNPAFDVTPSQNIAAIVTERGIARYPYTKSLLGFKP